MKIVHVIAWVWATVSMLAITSYGFDINAFSSEGLRYAMAWAFSFYQAGGNMIPNIGYQQYAEAWGTTKIK